MKKILVGVRFAPTGEELILDYLMNQLLGFTSLVVDAINEINILSYEPWFLPSLAKIYSGDLTWYFFSPIVYANSKKSRMQRTLDSGNGRWKSSGEDRIIKGKRSIKGEIGIKKSFVYYKKDITKPTPWSMHEYHITCLSQLSPELSNYVQNNYVISKVKYNGEDITFGGDNQSGQSQSFVSSDTSCNMGAINTWPQLGKEQEDVSMWDIMANTFDTSYNMRPINTGPEFQQQAQEIDNGVFMDPNTLSIDNNNPSVQPEAPNDDELMQFCEELSPIVNLNLNVHKPKKPVSGTIDYSSDSDDDDAESTSELSYQATSSPESVHNSNRHFLQTSGDDILLAYTSMDKTASVKTEKTEKNRFIAEETMETNHKNPRYIYLMNTMISFILLLGFFGNIIST